MRICKFVMFSQLSIPINIVQSMIQIYSHIGIQMLYGESAQLQGGTKRMDSLIFKSGDYNFNLIASIW